MSEEICAKPHDLGASNREITKPEHHHRCPLQNHLLPGASEARKSRAEFERATAEALAEAEVTGEASKVVSVKMAMPDENWPALAEVNGADLKRGDEYDLAFVELNDEGVQYLDRQMDALVAHLRRQDRAGVQNYVVAFVHGWRHNAQLRDGDVVKFRRLLAYSRAALNTRCIVEGTYCNAAVTGVFIGWNGQLVKEGDSDLKPDQGAPTGIAGLLPALTFWNRWDVSCRLGDGRRSCQVPPAGDVASPLRGVLDKIKTPLRLRQGDTKADKLLIFGHSMGGNMLATMLKEEAIQRVRNHPRGGRLKPLVGDLVVLLNPAAEATNWVEIQQAERARVGFKENENRLTCWNPETQTSDCSPEEHRKLAEWYRLYPVDQRPVMVSLTSAANWGTLRVKNRAVEHDTATGRIFPFARKVEGQSKREVVTAIGHLTPNYASRTALFPDAIAAGTSHEVAVLEGAVGSRARYRSRYPNAAIPEASWCAPAHGWLRGTREDWDNGGTVANWDTGYRADGSRIRNAPNIGGPANKARIQWRQSMNLRGNVGALSVSPGTSPFWNVRALDTAIRNHAAWANYPVWCALNQMVLDDVTAKVAAPVENPASEQE
ncbi:hypothetical protein RXV86_02770 [Alisedimentitalea sp. MJ-SS2]|uniref:hypothetical protein n=1 Tax=Aliisedimentitalea sp. MJ-SS2 TaxID=3049795 RepID=UPI002914C65F|nr:hypothetical protein [Alisedimentitalea sp. MJ-SS2]MDU8926298.1 hypothetical protein [Alisedimentitalea sp. MJ-SS2]